MLDFAMSVIHLLSLTAGSWKCLVVCLLCLYGTAFWVGPYPQGINGLIFHLLIGAGCIGSFILLMVVQSLDPPFSNEAALACIFVVAFGWTWAIVFTGVVFMKTCHRFFGWFHDPQLDR